MKWWIKVDATKIFDGKQCVVSLVESTERPKVSEHVYAALAVAGVKLEIEAASEWIRGEEGVAEGGPIVNGE